MFEIYLTVYLSAIIFSIAAGSLGCVVYWKRLGFIGDTISHSSLLGIALSLVYKVSPEYGLIVFAICFAIILTSLRKVEYLKFDILLSILSPICLAISGIIIATKNISIDLSSYLFGDLLLVEYKEIVILSIVTILSLIWLKIRWKKLLQIIISEEIFISSGNNLSRLRFETILILSIFISISIKLVGILLITSQLLIPALISRKISGNPTKMLCWSIITNMTTVLIGTYLAFNFDEPISPTIILVSTAIFLFTYMPKFKIN